VQRHAGVVHCDLRRHSRLNAAGCFRLGVRHRCHRQSVRSRQTVLGRLWDAHQSFPLDERLARLPDAWERRQQGVRHSSQRGACLLRQAYLAYS